MSAKYKTNPNDPVNNPLTGENSLTKKEHFALEIGKSYIQGISTRKPCTLDDIEQVIKASVKIAEQMIKELNDD